MKSQGTFLTMVLMMLVMTAFIPASSYAQDVEVFAEGAYTDTDLEVHIYANITGSTAPLCSFGVKLTYPPELSLDPAGTGTNKNDWYLGAEDYTAVYAGADEVVLIGGKLDPSDPTEGVSGSRVLLGKVRLTHSAAPMPPTLGLTYAQGDGSGAYKNFVASDGTVVDNVGVAFLGITTGERGDANLDGNFNVLDYMTIRDLLTEPHPPPYADCNDDGSLNVLDYMCIRAKTQ